MSDWITKEAEKIEKTLGQQASDEFLINYSNYWSKLVSQIKVDIQQINDSSAWQVALREPIKIEETDAGYRIKKTSFPSAFYIHFKNGGRTIELETEYKKSDNHDWESKTEILSVELDNHRIVLRRGSDILPVPEKAAEYILSTVLKAKNDSLEFFAKR